MYDFSNALADVSRRTREKLGLTQDQAAEMANIDPSHVSKMENINRNANPELATLYPYVRALNINPQEIFYPEIFIDNPRVRVLQQIISDFSDYEADAVIPVIRELKHFMRNIEDYKKIEE